MTDRHERIKELADRVNAWPPEQQADLAEVIKMLTDVPPRMRVVLSDDDVAEICRRMSVPNIETITLEEFISTCGRSTAYEGRRPC
jgi:hypothetical protein